jgi:hypothetical protein
VNSLRGPARITARSSPDMIRTMHRHIAEFVGGLAGDIVFVAHIMAQAGPKRLDPVSVFRVVAQRTCGMGQKARGEKSG